MKTIIAEKPSVAREIARIVGATKREEGYFEGGGYAVTWAFGHLVQLAMPDGYGIRGFVRDNLPVIPETFTLIPRQEKTEKGYKPDSGVVSQIKIIARLFKESEQIIVATDAGREGELIFRYLYHYIGCTTPFVRLWISSLTDKAIREGLRNLEAGDKIRQPLPCRQSTERIRLACGHQRHAGTLHRSRTRHIFRRTGADTHAGDGVRSLLGKPPFHGGTFLAAPYRRRHRRRRSGETLIFQEMERERTCHSTI